jgi:hypothetical protein
MKKQQVIIGERIKSILLPENGKKITLFKYQEKIEDHIDLIVNFTNHECFLNSKTLMSDLEIKIECIRDHDIFLVSLSQITKPTVGKIISYYKQNCREEKISESRIKEILEKLELSKNSSKDLSAMKNVDTSPEVKTEVVVDKIKQTSTPIEKVEVKPVFKPTKIKKVSKTKKEKKGPKYLLNKFFAYLILFEEGLDSPTMTHLSKFFTWETDGDLQILICRDDLLAINFEIAIRWHIENNYKVGPAINLEGNKITVDYSSPQNHEREKKVSTRSYCLPPNEKSTVGDMEERLHRVYHLPKPVVEKIDQYFKVKYTKKRLAKHIHTIISGMGWKSKVEDNILIIFTEPLPHEAIEELNTNPVVSDVIVEKVEKLSSIHTSRDDFDLKIHPIVNENHFFVINSKEEALAELEKLYYDPNLLTELSEETKNDIHFVLMENWKKEHPEEYARALLNFLKK